jgi:hypothetical protein
LHFLCVLDWAFSPATKGFPSFRLSSNAIRLELASSSPKPNGHRYKRIVTAATEMMSI